MWKSVIGACYIYVCHLDNRISIALLYGIAKRGKNARNAAVARGGCVINRDAKRRECPFFPVGQAN